MEIKSLGPLLMKIDKNSTVSNISRFNPNFATIPPDYKYKQYTLEGRLGNPGLHYYIFAVCLLVCSSTTAINHLLMTVWGYVPKHS